MTTETVQFTELVREAHSQRQRPRTFHLYYCGVCGNETIHRFVRDERSTGRELWRCSVCRISKERRT